MICCYQMTEICGSRYGFAIASSARGPCNFGPLTDLAVSVFGEVSINTVFNQIRTSRKFRLFKMTLEKNWRVSLCVQELYHPRYFDRLLAAIPICRNKTGLPILTRGLPFHLVLDFWLTWSTGLSILTVQHVHLNWFGVYPTQVFPCSSPTFP